MKSWIQGQIKRFMPVSRKRYNRDLQAEIQRADATSKNCADKINSIRHDMDMLRANHARQLAETMKTVNDVVSRCSSIDWRRDENRNQYAVTIRFDPAMMDGGYGGFGSDSQYREMIGKHFGSQVAHEIASMKFIQKVAQSYRHATN